MKRLVLVLGGLGISAIAVAQALRFADVHSDGRAWARLAATPSDHAATFDPEMVAGLPDPARRYFLFAIAPGTRLSRAVELTMAGEIGLGDKEKPNYLPMTARQILAGDAGFIWRVRAGAWKMWLSGSDGFADGNGWTRFWLYNLVPVVRAGGEENFARSAAGRAVAESVFWLPAALLPSASVRWEPVDADTARAVVEERGRRHIIELTVAADGRPLSVSLLRWSRENPEREWRLQPFGGTIGAIQEVDGYRIAASIEGGNWFGTAEYFPFYKARLTGIRFL